MWGQELSQIYCTHMQSIPMFVLSCFIHGLFASRRSSDVIEMSLLFTKWLVTVPYTSGEVGAKSGQLSRSLWYQVSRILSLNFQAIYYLESIWRRLLTTAVWSSLQPSPCSTCLQTLTHRVRVRGETVIPGVNEARSQGGCRSARIQIMLQMEQPV